MNFWMMAAFPSAMSKSSLSLSMKYPMPRKNDLVRSLATSYLWGFFFTPSILLAILR